MIARKLSLDEKMSRRIQKLDFAWFCSIAAPDASKKDLRILCDWGNWVSCFMFLKENLLTGFQVFPFDDSECSEKLIEANGPH
jgi:hypothetical protein